MDDAQVADHVAAGLANYTKERLAQAQVPPYLPLNLLPLTPLVRED
jgi:hypothetical protein